MVYTCGTVNWMKSCWPIIYKIRTVRIADASFISMRRIKRQMSIIHSFGHLVVHLNLILFPFSLIKFSVFIKRSDERISDYETHRRKVKTMFPLYGNIIVISIQFYLVGTTSIACNIVFCVSVSQFRCWPWNWITWDIEMCQMLNL